jgi:hypothetical protein
MCWLCQKTEHLHVLEYKKAISEQIWNGPGPEMNSAAARGNK